MRRRNFFAKKKNSSFLDLVKMVTENTEADETEGLDFDAEESDDDFDAESDDDFDMEDSDDEFDMEEDTDMGDEVTLSIPRDLAMQLMDALQAVIDGGEEVADEDGFDMEDSGDDFDSEEDVDVEDDGEGFDMEDSEGDESFEEDEEEVLGSDQSNVSSSAKGRKGAPSYSKFSKSWDNSKTVKSIFDQTASGEGDPAKGDRGAPSYSKFSKDWDKSKTVKSRFQPNKHYFEIGK